MFYFLIKGNQGENGSPGIQGTPGPAVCFLFNVNLAALSLIQNTVIIYYFIKAASEYSTSVYP